MNKYAIMRKIELCLGEVIVQNQIEWRMTYGGLAPTFFCSVFLSHLVEVAFTQKGGWAEADRMAVKFPIVEVFLAMSLLLLDIIKAGKFTRENMFLELVEIRVLTHV